MTALGSSVGTVTGRITRRVDRLSERWFAFWSFLPAALLVLVFVMPPIITAFGLAVWRWEQINDPSRNGFVGLNNFVRLASDREVFAAIVRTVYFGLGTTVLTIPVALFAAIVLNRPFRGVSLLGVALLLPWAVAGVVTGLYWKFIFQPHFGLATSIATVLGLTSGPVDWLFDTTTAVIVAVIASAWRAVPLFALLLLASLKTIPEALYRAAKMDGAGTWGSFRHVTLPSIRNMLVIVTMLSIINALQVFDVLFTLTRGGPGRQTTVLIYYVYESTIDRLSFGYGAAMALLLLGVIVLCSSALLLIRLRSRQRVVEDDLAAELMAPDVVRPIRAPAIRRATGADTTVGVYPTAGYRRRYRLRVPRWVKRLGFAVGAGALTLWLVGPIAWIALTSTQPEGAITQAPPALTFPTLNAYSKLLAIPGWVDALWLSTWISLLTTGITIILGALAAYPLARLDLPLKGVAIAFLILTQMIPGIVLVIPAFFLFRILGLYDTPQALVLINVAFLLPLIIWLLKNIFQEVPRALESAARIDGCSRLGTLFRVTMPAAAPGIAATSILILIGTWNEFLFAVVLGNRATITVTRQIGFIDTIAGPLGSPPFTVIAAAGVVSILPCLILVLLFHRRIVAGITQGFVKG